MFIPSGYAVVGDGSQQNSVPSGAGWAYFERPEHRIASLMEGDYGQKKLRAMLPESPQVSRMEKSQSETGLIG